jgi:23S rRNA pseudouridine2604 synthase
MPVPIRLAKRVAELCACSRRKAELLIAGSWVRVDGVVIEEPHFRVTDERVDIDPKANIDQAAPVTLLLNNPVGACTELGDNQDAPPAAQGLVADRLWEEDRSGLRPLQLHFAQLTACAPLETSAGGLVVFTQDWRVARRLNDDAATLEHEVVIEVAGELTADGLARLNRGIPFQGHTPPTIKVSWQNETRLRVALKGCRVGQIAHMCAAVGVQMVSMKRIRLGGVSLGKVPPGQWRYLRTDERF